MKHLYCYIVVLVKWCTSAGGALGALILFLMALLITIDVIGREVGHPIGVAFELSGYCLVAIIFLGLGYTLRLGKHIEISVVTSRLHQRASRWLKVVTSSIGIAFIGWLFWFSLQHAIRSYLNKSVSMTLLAVPLWWVQVLMPIGLGLLASAMMVATIRIIKHNRN